MTTKKRGLGRGLDALLGTGNSRSQENQAEKNEAAVEVAINPDLAAESGQPVNTSNENNSLKYLPVEFIQPGKYQPRLDMRP